MKFELYYDCVRFHLYFQTLLNMRFRFRNRPVVVCVLEMFITYIPSGLSCQPWCLLKPLQTNTNQDFIIVILLGLVYLCGQVVSPLDQHFSGRGDLFKVSYFSLASAPAHSLQCSLSPKNHGYTYLCYKVCDIFKKNVDFLVSLYSSGVE